ncbi:hypothetical protein [Pseudalkalibacillus berkeleyi]|uniref:Uncharacterized protein n=1 Tax=Pseudalkalibacillus berkeleyi TaxID=1069813 RepID=A0ABS9H154_9BACL|nr:hypothetical protein [Pseudalkalibacillus berkeleyi]MCF6137513.1 hypothetical protein [Pseudalkalibacillus berkeleyi]
MYERYSDIEKVCKAMKTLEDINGKDPCYSTACTDIQSQLHEAISFESGYQLNMSKYANVQNKY